MRATIHTAALVAAVVVCACGDDANTAGDGGGSGSDGGGSGSDGGSSGVCGPPPPFSTGKTPSRTITVSSSTMSGDHPSIEAAAAAATPGTRIQLLPGMHQTDQFVANLRGTEAEPIWITGMTGVVISGGGQALQLQRAAYVVLEAFEVANTTANGINIDDGGAFDDPLAAHHVVVDGVRIHDIGSAGGNNDCLKVSGIRDLYVLRSEFRNCGGGGSGIDHVGVHRSVISRNTFDARMGNAVQSKGGSTDHDIEYNSVRITGSRAFNVGGSTDLTLFRPSLSTSAPNAEARRIRVYDNIVWGLDAMATPFAIVGCVDCIVAHNGVRGSYRWHMRILQETPTDSAPYTFEPARDGLVANNVFEFSSVTLNTAVNVGGDTDPGSFVFRNNLWYATNGGSSTPSLPTPETGGVVGTSSEIPWRDDLREPTSCVTVEPAPLLDMGHEIPIGEHGAGCVDSTPSIGPLLGRCAI
ncbi:MAG: right-handed parallel beta-helix repeat-containing protein [Kofleriaceae bacterium]